LRHQIIELSLNGLLFDAKGIKNTANYLKRFLIILFINFDHLLKVMRIFAHSVIDFY